MIDSNLLEQQIKTAYQPHPNGKMPLEAKLAIIKALQTIQTGAYTHPQLSERSFETLLALTKNIDMLTNTLGYSHTQMGVLFAHKGDESKITALIEKTHAILAAIPYMQRADLVKIMELRVHGNILRQLSDRTDAIKTKFPTAEALKQFVAKTTRYYEGEKYLQTFVKNVVAVNNSPIVPSNTDNIASVSNPNTNTPETSATAIGILEHTEFSEFTELDSDTHQFVLQQGYYPSNMSSEMILEDFPEIELSNRAYQVADMHMGHAEHQNVNDDNSVCHIENGNTYAADTMITSEGDLMILVNNEDDEDDEAEEQLFEANDEDNEDNESDMMQLDDDKDDKDDEDEQSFEDVIGSYCPPLLDENDIIMSSATTQRMHYAYQPQASAPTTLPLSMNNAFKQ